MVFLYSLFDGKMSKTVRSVSPAALLLSISANPEFVRFNFFLPLHRHKEIQFQEQAYQNQVNIGNRTKTSFARSNFIY